MRYLLITLLLLSGCATATIKTTAADGKVCEGSYTALFLNIDESAMSACGAKNSAVGSKVNTEFLNAFMQALVSVK